MKSRKLVASALAALSLFVVSAQGGTKFTGTGAVTVSLQASGAGSATGYLGHVWNAPQTTQWIGCNLSAKASGSLYCHARSDSGQLAFCSSSSKFLAESLAALGPDVRLTFSWNASGVCDSITIAHSSQYAPKL